VQKIAVSGLDFEAKQAVELPVFEFNFLWEQPFLLLRFSRKRLFSTMKYY